MSARLDHGMVTRGSDESARDLFVAEVRDYSSETLLDLSETVLTIFVCGAATQDQRGIPWYCLGKTRIARWWRSRDQLRSARRRAKSVFQLRLLPTAASAATAVV